VHRARKSGGRLGTRQRRLGVYKMQEISYLAEKLSEYQGFRSMELFTYLFNEESNTQFKDLAAETFISYVHSHKFLPVSLLNAQYINTALT
jgi:hypothetical protein